MTHVFNSPCSGCGPCALGDMEIDFQYSTAPADRLQNCVDFLGDQVGTVLSTNTCANTATAYLTENVDQVLANVGQAFYDGAWTSSTTIAIYGAWRNGDAGTVTLSVTWQGTTKNLTIHPPGVHAHLCACTQAQLATITLYDDGSFDLG